MSKRAPTQRDALDCGWISLSRPENWQGVKTVEQKQELSRRAHALNEGMRMPLSRKIDYSMRVIERALATPGVKWALSYSAGRDSTILSHLLVEKMGQAIPHVMSNTRMEYPEVLRQAAQWRPWLAARGVELHVVYPDKRPKEVWAEGYPLWSKDIASKVRQYQATGNPKHLGCIPADLHEAVHRVIAAGIKVTEKCCDRLKKEPMAKWNKANGIGGHLTGVRCEESRARRLMYIQRGSLYHSNLHGEWLAHPLTHWTEADLVAYVERHGLVIDRNGRSGCATCGFGAHVRQKEGNENALQRLARENPRMHAVALNDWGYKKALDAAGIDYGQLLDDLARHANAAMDEEEAELLATEVADNG